MENKHKHNPNLNEFNKYKSMEGQIRKSFTYHPPKENQIPRYNILRDKGLNLADCIDNLCPPSREKSLAITHLEDAVMWANAAIARNE